MKGCMRVYVCPACGHQLIVMNGKKRNLPCECMLERAAIQAESREAEAEYKKKLEEQS